MKNEFNQIYQFKITLEGVRPPIWRRIQVPETYSFRDLHIAIQDVMGWGDYHLYEFHVDDVSIDYPICITGKRACPPDDCGGVRGYENFLEIIEDPNHSEHEEMLEWIGGEFDPEYFDVKEIHFRGLMTRNKRSKQVIV